MGKVIKCTVCSTKLTAIEVLLIKCECKRHLCLKHERPELHDCPKYDKSNIAAKATLEKVVSDKLVDRI